jgi:hypothetical protein
VLVHRAENLHRLRHCERSAAIQSVCRVVDCHVPRIKSGVLAMTIHIIGIMLDFFRFKLGQICPPPPGEGDHEVVEERLAQLKTEKLQGAFPSTVRAPTSQRRCCAWVLLVQAQAMPKMRKKADLPTKTCAACGLRFVWRKKWARDWEDVRYCSDKCRAGRLKSHLLEL